MISRCDGNKPVIWLSLTPHRLVTWISPVFGDEDTLRRRSHFRVLPKPRHIDLKTYFDHGGLREIILVWGVRC